MNVLCLRRVDRDLGKEFREKGMEDGTFSLQKRQNDHMYSVGKNAAIADCWDIDHGSLVSCSFL